MKRRAMPQSYDHWHEEKRHRRRQHVQAENNRHALIEYKHFIGKCNEPRTRRESDNADTGQ